MFHVCNISKEETGDRDTGFCFKSGVPILCNCLLSGCHSVGSPIIERRRPSFLQLWFKNKVISLTT